MKLIQPPPDNQSPLNVAMADRVECAVPLYFVRYRYPHHAAAAGYDRLCDYVGKTVKVSDSLYILGETVLRPFCLAHAKWAGHYEYSRYDCVMESAAIRHFQSNSRSVYHFVYAEKSFKRMAAWSGRNGNKIIGTIHHPPEHNKWLFRDLKHFNAFDHLLVMSEDQVPYWQGVTGRDNVSFLPHGVDTEYFSPLEKRRCETVRCIFVGAHERDFESLCNIVSRVLTTHPEIEIDLVSRDSTCGKLAERFAQVTWYQRVSDAEYLWLLRSADLMLLPLSRSTACNAVLEALACGVPVVTNRGGIESYLSADTGVCVAASDHDAFARAVVNLVGDYALRSRTSKAARLQALTFSWPRVAERVAALAERLLEEN